MRVMFWIGSAAAMAVAACGPQRPVGAPPDTLAAHGCEAAAEFSWTAGAGYRISASTIGATCGDAEATLHVADAAGAVVFSEAFAAANVLPLAHVENAAQMQAALAEWIDPAGAAIAASGDLPAWAPGADTPMSGEFPFYPEGAFEREAYEALRARNTPMFCYVQGMESYACHALENGVLTKVGVQTFPG